MPIEYMIVLQYYETVYLQRKHRNGNIKTPYKTIFLFLNDFIFNLNC